ncbi:MAG: Yip1 family protein [Planifilum fimeticola]
MKPESSSNLSPNKGPTLWGMLFAPTEQFERMIDRPRFGWALAAMMLVGSIAAALVAYSVALETPIPEEAQMIDPAQIAMGAAFLGFVGGLVGVPVTLLLISLIQKLFLMLFQGEATFRQLFSLNTHLYLFSLLASLIMAVMVLLLGPQAQPDIFPTSLAALVPAEGALRGVLNGIELFALWKLFLTAKGLSTLARLSSGKAWTIALILFAGGLLFAALGGWFSEMAESFQPPQG